jgi:hypothetical protein
MKKIIIVIILHCFVFSFNPYGKVNLSNDFFSVGLGDMMHLSQKQSFMFDVVYGKSLKSSFGLNLGYKKQEDSFAWVLGIENLLAEYLPESYSMGLSFPWGTSDLELGLLSINKNFIPYFTFRHNMQPFSPYIRLADQILFGINYQFNFESELKKEYFKMIQPVGNIETRLNYIEIKGYLLDYGRIYINDKEIFTNEDGIFNEILEVPNLGRNDFYVFIEGKNIGNKKFEFIVNRKLPYSDLDIEIQRNWFKMLEIANLPNDNYFLPEAPITKGEFYLILGRIKGFEKNIFSFPDYFVNVQNNELKEYLYSFYGHGYIRTTEQYFNSTSNILRQEALTVLSRILPETNDANKDYVFNDVSTKNWVYPYINKLANYNVLNEENINPKGSLTRVDLFSYIYAMKDFFHTLKETKIETPIIPLTFFKEESSTEIVDFSRFTFNDLTLLSPIQSERVEDSRYYVKGFGPSGISLIINSNNIKANQYGRFAHGVNLFPGINKITIELNNEKKEFLVLYLKKFLDLDNNNQNTLFEQISTITGYRKDEENFYPNEFITKKELVSVLYNLGYFTKSRHEELISQLDKEEEILKIELEDSSPEEDENKELEIEKNYATAKEAVVFFKMLTESTFEPFWGDENLTRKNLVLLISEIPSIKEKIMNFFEVKNSQ